MKKGKFATAVAKRPSQIQKGSMPSVKPSSMSTTKNTSSVPMQATIKGKGSLTRHGTAKRMAITRSPALSPKTVQKISSRPAIKTMKPAKASPSNGKPIAKNGPTPVRSIPSPAKNSDKHRLAM